MNQGNLSGLLQSRLFTTMVRISPWRIAFVSLWLVTLLYFLAHRETRLTIRRNIQDVFARIHDREAVDAIFRSALKGVFYHYLEKLYVAYSGDQQWKDYCLERIRVTGRRTVDRYLRKNRGVILVTAHFGAVELLPGLLTLLGYPVAIIAKFKTPRLKKKCEKRAQSVGAEIIDANEPSSFFMALSALRQGRILITECDEVECWRTDPKRAIQVFGTFFQFDRTPTILQRRSGCPVVFGYVRREGKGHYAAEIEDVCGPDGDYQEGIGVTILRKLEKLVYTHPDQWYIWKNFQRMKTTPVGEIAVEDRRRYHIPVTPPTFPTLQPPRTVTELHGQYCPQASV
jgi:KDO2-lipid IV(A) lauroyltransferase